MSSTAVVLTRQELVAARYAREQAKVAYHAVQRALDVGGALDRGTRSALEFALEALEDVS